MTMCEYDGGIVPMENLDDDALNEHLGYMRILEAF